MNITKLFEVQMSYEDEESKNISVVIINALIFVVENHFRHMGSYFVLTFMCRERFFCNYYNDLLDTLFLSWEPMPMQVVSILANQTERAAGQRDLNLIFVDTFESFSSIDLVSHTAQNDHNEYYYIFLQNFDHLLNGEMAKIFDYCWRNYLINCNVQIQTSRGEILVYTYYPFNPGNCHNITIRLINRFKGESMIHETLFPKKLSNFHRCSLRAAMWDVPPFIHLKELGNGLGYVTGGVDGRLLKELSTRMNFTIVVKVPPNNEQRGSSDPKNLTGAFRMLNDRTVDFSLGFFRFNKQRLKVATATTTFYQSAQVICIPVEAYEYSSLEILLYPFSHSAWRSIVAIFSFATTVIWLHKRRHCSFQKKSDSTQDHDHTHLNMYLMSLGMPATKMPKRAFTRLICLDWIFLTLLLRTSYQAFLFHFMRTQPIGGLPSTVDDLVAQNYTITMNVNTLPEMVEVEFMAHLNWHVINDTKETIAIEYVGAKADRKVVAVVASAFVAYYKYETRKVNDFQLLKQNIYIMPITMYLTKHSFLADHFNEMLNRFVSAGLTKAWIRAELDLLYVSKRQTEVKFFKLEDLYMLFVILVVGHSLALIVFSVEFLRGKVKK